MKTYVYFCEGECEVSLAKALKESQRIQSGKIFLRNPAGDSFKSFARSFGGDAVFVLIFDTDTPTSLQKLQANIRELLSLGSVLLIPQVNNFEDEIVFCTSLRKATELFSKCNDLNELKRRMREVQPFRLNVVLREKRFDFNKLWSRLPNNEFAVVVGGSKNDSHKIKLK